jgi:hypothetical protein
MSRYFVNYPTIEYNGKNVKDITRRSKVIDDVLGDPYVFLPYTISEDEKPETIAQFYYGSVDDTWLVLFANNITDPYTQWPLNEDEFNQYFIEKYSELSNRSGFDVIRWGQDETRFDNVVYYYKEIDTDIEDPQEFFPSGSSTFVDVTEEQLQEILDDQIVTINGIQYKLVKE